MKLYLNLNNDGTHLPAKAGMTRMLQMNTDHNEAFAFKKDVRISNFL